MANVIHHSPDGVEAHVIMREARALRAEAMATLMAAAGRAIVNGFRRIGHSLVGLAEAVEAGRRAHALHTELSQMSDRQLAEAGIAREDIPAMVARAVTAPERTPAPVVGEIGRSSEASVAPEAEVRKAA